MRESSVKLPEILLTELLIPLTLTRSLSIGDPVTPLLEERGVKNSDCLRGNGVRGKKHVRDRNDNSCKLLPNDLAPVSKPVEPVSPRLTISTSNIGCTG